MQTTSAKTPCLQLNNRREENEAYEDVLSIILDEPNLRLKAVKVEEVILNKVGKRARFYQGMLDTPILKSGKKTRYKNLPSTIIIFKSSRKNGRMQE